jgi:putative ABC transport system permease protein
MMMTILMAVVGSMGLSGTLSINVIERRREIGVMRAVGASSRDVGLVFTGEGLMLGLTSWVLALPLGLSTAPPFVWLWGK